MFLFGALRVCGVLGQCAFRSFVFALRRSALSPGGLQNPNIISKVERTEQLVFD